VSFGSLVNSHGPPSETVRDNLGFPFVAQFFKLDPPAFAYVFELQSLELEWRIEFRREPTHFWRAESFGCPSEQCAALLLRETILHAAITCLSSTIAPRSSVYLPPSDACTLIA